MDRRRAREGRDEEERTGGEEAKHEQASKDGAWEGGVAHRSSWHETGSSGSPVVLAREEEWVTGRLGMRRGEWATGRLGMMMDDGEDDDGDDDGG